MKLVETLIMRLQWVYNESNSQPNNESNNEPND